MKQAQFKLNNFKNTLCFKQWSRKSYAIFQSLGRIIKIAFLKTLLANNFIKKSISLQASTLAKFGDIKLFVISTNSSAFQNINTNINVNSFLFETTFYTSLYKPSKNLNSKYLF